ncbi:MAG: GFA family protein [Rhodospirillaceae bacterium]|jgi:hypothetical protein|nr:GFA family protein [Rhodospirillaceae bacterium]MBT5458574.1 GFA family protein [Rhodospirillaceae bacterium]
MTTKATGQCLCGAVTYETEIPEKPFYAGLCHCKDCQRYTGTAFASSLMVPKAGMTLKGELKFYGKDTDRGTVMERGFCPQCGSNVLCRSADWDDQYVLSAGTLDDPSLYKPRINIFTRSAHAHVFKAGDLRSFEGNPEK